MQKYLCTQATFRALQLLLAYCVSRADANSQHARGGRGGAASSVKAARVPGSSSKVAVGLVQRALLLLSYLLPAVRLPYQEHMQTAVEIGTLPTFVEPSAVHSVREDELGASSGEEGGTWKQPNMRTPSLSCLLSDGIQWYVVVLMSLCEHPLYRMQPS